MIWRDGRGEETGGGEKGRGERDGKGRDGRGKETGGGEEKEGGAKHLKHAPSLL